MNRMDHVAPEREALQGARHRPRAFHGQAEQRRSGRILGQPGGQRPGRVERKASQEPRDHSTQTSGNAAIRPARPLHDRSIHVNRP